MQQPIASPRSVRPVRLHHENPPSHPIPPANDTVHLPTPVTKTVAPQGAPVIDFVRYNDFDANRLIGTKPEQKNIPNSTNKYHDLPLAYNYGTPEAPQFDECLLEFPRVRSRIGLQKRTEPNNGRVSWSIMITLPKNDPKIDRLIQTIDAIYRRCRQFIYNNRGPLKLYDFTVDGTATFKHPIYQHRTDDGDINETRNPCIWLKLIHGAYGKTEFYRPVSEAERQKSHRRGASIDWSILEGAEIDIIPLVKVEKIYIGGGKPSLQLKMISAIVISVRPQGAGERQNITIDEVTAEDPDLVDRLGQQLALMASTKADYSGDGNVSPTPTSYTQPDMDSFLASAPRQY